MDKEFNEKLLHIEIKKDIAGDGCFYAHFVEMNLLADGETIHEALKVLAEITKIHMETSEEFNMPLTFEPRQTLLEILEDNDE